MKKIGYIFTGAGMLAICSVLGKLLGAMYRIPLTNVLGGEGMGLYQMVFPLYTLLLTLSSGGLPVAISRLVAVKLAGRDERGATKVLRVSVAALSAVGLIGSFALAASGRFLARVQGNPAAAPAYLGIAPSVFFVAVLSCFRGYYQGRENMLPSAASQLVEQTGKLAAGLFLAAKLAPRGLSYAVLGALLGVSISEVLATLLLLAVYLLGAGKRRRNLIEARRRTLLHGLGSDAGFGTEPLRTGEEPSSNINRTNKEPFSGINPTPEKCSSKPKMHTWGAKNGNNSQTEQILPTKKQQKNNCANNKNFASEKTRRVACSEKACACEATLREEREKREEREAACACEATLRGNVSALRERALRRRGDRARRSDERRAAREAAAGSEAIARGSESDFAGDLTAELGLTAANAGLQSSCKRTKQRNPDSVLGILKAIAAVALPVTFGSLVLPVTQVADSVLIINILARIGYSADAATMAYGLVNGTVMTLVNMPVVVIFAFSAALLPKIAKACAEPETVAREAGLSLKLCVALGLAAFLAIFVYARPLVAVLYARGLTPPQQELCAGLLKLSAFTALYVSIVQVCTAVLQGLDLAKKPALALAVGAVVKVAVTAALLFSIGIYGAVVGSIACYAVTAVIDLVLVRRRVPLRLSPRKAFVPYLAAAAFLAVGITTRELLAFLPPLLLIAASAVPALAAYLAVTLACHWLDKSDLRRLF